MACSKVSVGSSELTTWLLPVGLLTRVTTASIREISETVLRGSTEGRREWNEGLSSVIEGKWPLIHWEISELLPVGSRRWKEELSAGESRRWGHQWDAKTLKVDSSVGSPTRVDEIVFLVDGKTGTVNGPGWRIECASKAESIPWVGTTWYE